VKVCAVSSRIYVPGAEPGPDCSSVLPSTTTPQPGSTTEDPGGGGGGCIGQIIDRACRLADLRDSTMHWTLQVLLPQYGGRLNQPFDTSNYAGFLPSVQGAFPSWCGVPANFPVIGLGPTGIVYQAGGTVQEKVGVSIVREALGFGNCAWRFGRGYIAYVLPAPPGGPLGQPFSAIGAAHLENIVPQIQCPETGTGPVQIDITANMVPLMVGGSDVWHGFPFYNFQTNCPIAQFMLSGPFHLRITGG